MKKLLRKIFLELNPKHDLDYVSSLEPLQFREIEEIQAVEAPLVFRKMARGAVIGGLIGGFTSAATGSDLAYSVLIGATLGGSLDGTQFMGRCPRPHRW